MNFRPKGQSIIDPKGTVQLYRYQYHDRSTGIPYGDYRQHYVNVCIYQGLSTSHYDYVRNRTQLARPNYVFVAARAMKCLHHAPRDATAALDLGSRPCSRVAAGYSPSATLVTPTRELEPFVEFWGF